jgi:positive regulator of sigma E activity
MINGDPINFESEPLEGILHTGVVQTWHDGTAEVRVSMDQPGGCAACGARDGCGAAASGRGKPAQTIEIPYPSPLEPGQKVEVMMAKNTDWKATALAFGLPVALMLLGLCVGTAADLGEAVTALLSIGLLLPYGLGLVLFRRGLKATFAMRIVRVERS